MKIYLYLSDQIFIYDLPTEISGSFSFDPIEEELYKLINIEERNGNWVLYSTGEVSLIKGNEKIEYENLEHDKFYTLERDNVQFLIYVKEYRTYGMSYFKYFDAMRITVGNSFDNDIIYNCPYTKNTQLIIEYHDNNVVLSVVGKNFLYLNQSISKNEQNIINYGDEFDLFGIKMIFMKDYFMVINSERISYNNDSKLLKYKYKMPDFSDEKDVNINQKDLYKKEDFYFKSPRIKRVIEEKEIQLTTPPNTQIDQDLPLLVVIGPMLTMGLISIIRVIDIITKIQMKETTLEQSWLQLLTALIMMTSALVWPFVTQIYRKVTRKRKLENLIERYKKYLNVKRDVLEKEKIMQKSILLENLKSPEECLNIIKQKKYDFWDRRIDQSDFLNLNLGTGKYPLAVNYSYSEEDFASEESEIREAVNKLMTDYKYIEDVPIGYSFYDNKITAIMGKRNHQIKFMNSLILQALTYYTYEDIKVVILTNNQHKVDWEYLKFTNHNFTNNKDFRFFGVDAESIKNVADYLEFEINNRLNYLRSNVSLKSLTQKPYYLVITDDYEKIKRYNFVDILSETEENLSFSLIILENKMSNLPSKCTNFINLDNTSSGVLKNAYEKQEHLEFKFDFTKNINMIEVAKEVSNTPIEFEENANALVNSISFLEMEKVGKVEQLNILHRWNNNDATSSLKAEIGVDAFNDLMYLDLHEKQHGPHGLIAGMTGSGKSEFIITYILSMAMNYSPEFVSFILIDYKGGGLAYAFENKSMGLILPHLAGTITNLDKSEMARTLVSIDSEVKRRQRIFNEARDQLNESTMDIYKYQKYYKEGKLSNPVPHLFIISDEFAELKSQQPDFMDNLISIARIGRSLGVHLILATQKPSGVVNDQIWSNSKFKVCLKVQDENDSREVLKKTDAAYLKQTGRFYLQVGFDEYFALGQSAWCGAKYYPSDNIVKEVDNSINFINDNAFIYRNVQASVKNQVEAKGDQLTAILTSIIEVAKQTNKFSSSLWLESLPSKLLLEKLEEEYKFEKEKYNVKAIIGKYDAPEIQEQGLVVYDFLEDENTLIYGNDGLEKELLLNQIIYSSTKMHSALELNYYIVDYGSETLTKWSKLPHVGGVVDSSDSDKYENLMKLIKSEFKFRKKLFLDYGGDYKNYIKIKHDLPLRVVVINNYDSLYENHQELYDELPELVRDSARYGIIFIVTANGINSVHNKIAQNFKNIYTYKLKTPSDYLSLFNTKTKLVPNDIFGRGLVNNNGVHEFQTATMIEDDNDMVSFVNEFIKEQQMLNEKGALQIPVLPEVIRYDDVKENLKDIYTIPVGISKKELQIVNMNCSDNICNIITSNKLDNTINFVSSLLKNFKSVCNELYIFDSTKEKNINIYNYENYFVDNFDQHIESIINKIQNLIENNLNEPGMILINGVNKFMSKLENQSTFEQLINVLKKYDNFRIVMVDDYNKLKSLMFETWFTSSVDTSNGIWIGRGIVEQNLLKISGVNKELTKDVTNEFGYVVNEGMPVLCKLINYIEEEESL